jgi:hypothetical protein
MRLRTLLVSVAAGGLGRNSTNVAPVSTGSSKRSYNGSASIGDFLAITLDPVALTLTCKNLSKGEHWGPYTVNPDGTYALNDPNHNFSGRQLSPKLRPTFAGGEGRPQAQRAGPGYSRSEEHNFIGMGLTTITTTCSSGPLPEVVPYLWTRRQVSA